MKAVVKGPANLAGSEFRIVKNNGKLDTDAPLLFTFHNFKITPINIDGTFNNFFNSQEEYVRKITILMDKALPLLSNERYSLFNDLSKTKAMHLHRLNDREDILRKIFEKYGFNSDVIDELIEGAELYQLEVPFENGATRIVFERIDNLISFLFLDPNHHIYMNPKLVNNDNSLFYEYCPIYKSKTCKRMDYLHTCFAFDYLDIEKYLSTFSYGYDPSKNS
ncbi:hypothetical protein [Oribacterium sinus]